MATELVAERAYIELRDRIVTLRLAPGSSVVAETTGDAVVLRGRVGAVDDAGASAHLLVSAQEPTGRSQYLVPLGAPGVERAPRRSVDLTRRFHDVTLADVTVSGDGRVGPAGAADEQDASLLDVVAVLAAGEIVGAMDRAFGPSALGGDAVLTLSELTPLRFLLTPGLWAGLLFAAFCIAGAVHFRRVREPM